jgi:hypothetical protein
MNTANSTILIWAKSRGPSTCKGCGAAIEWATVVASGRKLCFDGTIVPLAEYEEPDGRMVQVVDLSKNHWATCPKRDQFKQTRKASVFR